MFLEILEQERPDVEEIKSVLKVVREKISEADKVTEDLKEKLIQSEIQSLYGKGNRGMTRRRRAGIVDAEGEIIALEEIEKRLKNKLLEALYQKRDETIVLKDHEIEILKRKEKEFEELSVRALGRFHAIIKGITGDYPNPSYQTGPREMYFEAMEEMEKELGIFGEKPIKSKIIGLKIEKEVLAKQKYNLDEL